jgi:hypothetical protein
MARAGSRTRTATSSPVPSVMALASSTTTTMTIQGRSESLPDECERRPRVRLCHWGPCPKSSSQPPIAGTRARRRTCRGQSEARPGGRKAIADAQEIVGVWNARQAGGRALWFYLTIGAAIAAGLPWLSLSCPACGQRLNRSPHVRSAPERSDLELDPLGLMPAVLAERAVRSAGNVDGRTPVSDKKERPPLQRVSPAFSCGS